MRYEHRFRVQATQQAVADFHRHAWALKALTPPMFPMRIHHAPEPLKDGDHVVFTLWMGPAPLRWDSRIEDVSVQGFTDVQEQGVFGSWQHRHTFAEVDRATTEVVDEIEATLPHQPGRWVLALAMWVGLPMLFAYRAWRTRHLLEQP